MIIELFNESWKKLLIRTLDFSFSRLEIIWERIAGEHYKDI